MGILQIEESNARNIYKTASSELKIILEDTFGKEFFSQKVTERIKQGVFCDCLEDMGDPQILNQDETTTINGAFQRAGDQDDAPVDRPFGAGDRLPAPVSRPVLPRAFFQEARGGIAHRVPQQQKIGIRVSDFCPLRAVNSASGTVCVPA